MASVFPWQPRQEVIPWMSRKSPLSRNTGTRWFGQSRHHPGCGAAGHGILRCRCASISCPRSKVLARYGSRGGWVLVHIGAGAVALLIGPVQLWLGVSRRAMQVHRRLGLGTSRVGNQRGRRVLPGSAHQPWMGVRIRHHEPRHRLAGDDHAGRRGDSQGPGPATPGVDDSQLCGDLRVRHIPRIMDRVASGRCRHAHEQLAASSWFCWAVPLLIVEAVLQGRRSSPSATLARPESSRISRVGGKKEADPRLRETFASAVGWCSQRSTSSATASRSGISSRR